MLCINLRLRCGFGLPSVDGVSACLGSWLFSICRLLILCLGTDCLVLGCLSGRYLRLVWWFGTTVSVGGFSGW